MALTLNTQLASLKLSGIRRFSALAQQTPGCISLTLGEPGENTPDPIKREVTADLARNLTHYPPNNGYRWFREAIARFERERGVPIDIACADQTIATDGATEALFVALTLVLNPGDEVIVSTPAFSLYESIGMLQRAVIVPFDTEPFGFQIDPDALESVVTERTKALVVCSPNNPTGCVLNAASLDAVATVARRHNLFVICDDVYSKLVYTTGYEAFCVRHPELGDRTLVVNSFSKPWAMTGWRLGWLMGPSWLMREAAKIHQYMVSSVPAFLQHAGVVALEGSTEQMRQTYARRRETVMRELHTMELPMVEPEGAFYAFPCIRQFGLGSEEFCERAIREVGIALVPGVFFGAEGYVRLSYACGDETLEQGLERLAQFVKRLRQVPQDSVQTATK